MQPVIIGTVGAGYAARLHANGYKNVASVPFKLKTICDVNTKLAEEIKQNFNYERVESDFDLMLQDPEINLIDIVTPPFLHIPMAIKALQAGKNVICEKPLTGYFGHNGEERIGLTTPRALMYESVINEMNKLREVLNESDKKFLYAENLFMRVRFRKLQKLSEQRNLKFYS